MGATISTFKLLSDTKLHPHSVSNGYLTSSTISLINPRNTKGTYETVSLYLPADKLKHLSDERILALFTKGFFGGWVFRFESILTRAGGYKIMGPPNFPGFQPLSEAKEIWDVTTLPKDKILPVGSLIVGSFQVLASHVFTQPKQHPQYSFIDFSFGSSAKLFAGNHRFIVRRPAKTNSSHRNQRAPGVRARNPQPAEASDDERAGLLEGETTNSLKDDEVEIRLEGYHCNPLEDGFWAGKRLFFHEWYARLLFLNGVRSVLGGAAQADRDRKST